MTDITTDQLKKSVETQHNCAATFRNILPVREVFKGQVVWDGVVHVFDVNHPDTNTCYAWSSPIEDSDNRKFYAALGVPPVNSAKDAVRAAIVAESRQNRN